MMKNVASGNNLALFWALHIKVYVSLLYRRLKVFVDRRGDIQMTQQKVKPVAIPTRILSLSCLNSWSRKVENYQRTNQPYLFFFFLWWCFLLLLSEFYRWHRYFSCILDRNSGRSRASSTNFIQISFGQLYATMMSWVFFFSYLQKIAKSFSKFLLLFPFS